MTKSLRNDYPYNVINYPSLGADIDTTNNQFMVHQLGIDTIRLTPIYSTLIKVIERMGLEAVKASTNSPVSRTITKLLKEAKQDSTKRYKVEKFSPIVEVVKLTKGKSVSNYMIIIRNTPLLFDLATHHKKAKDTFCMVVFTGLHQPTKRIESEAISLMSKFLKRKTFKLHSVDIAIDTTDHKHIKHSRKGAFKDDLYPYSSKGVISKGSSLYINKIDHNTISRILYYDKYLKQTQHHKQERISNDLRAWKRLEVTLTFDVTQPKPKNFTDYIESYDFIEDLERVDKVARLANIEGFDRDYLLYQLNSLIDNRFLNNRESQQQFNSVEALERFKSSDFRRYILPV